MTTLAEDPKAKLLLQERLADLGLQDSPCRALLLARLERDRQPGESLEDCYARSLCRWLERWLERLEAPPLGEGPAALAAAEAAVALSGIAGRWPKALLHPTAELPAEARQRLLAALPLATPPVVPRAMPAQTLEPVALPALLALPLRGGQPAKARR